MGREFATTRLSLTVLEKHYMALALMERIERLSVIAAVTDQETRDELTSLSERELLYQLRVSRDLLERLHR